MTPEDWKQWNSLPDDWVGEQPTESERQALKYATKFVSDSDLDPSDDELSRVFEHCALRAPRDLYPVIRRLINELRGESSEIRESHDDTPRA